MWLRPLVDADLAPLFAQQVSPEANAMAGTKPRTWEAYQDAMRKALADPRVVARVIVAAGPLGEVRLGGVSCFQAEGQDAVGYWVARAYWGRGVASRAVELLVAEVPRRPLHAVVAAHNVASRRVMAKSGFREVSRRMGEETERYVGCEIVDFILE